MRPDTEYWDAMAAHGAEAAVIDPNDRGGRKNAYITALRTRALLAELPPAPARVLDFGCGSGGMLVALTGAGYQAVGVDIARELLRLAGGRPGAEARVLYDGARLPFAEAAFDAACSYVVLNHVLDDAALVPLLRQIACALRPGGRFVAIEQIRRRTRLQPHTHQRSLARWHELFDAGGFRVARHATLRYGHFPLTYLVRYGVWPRRWHAAAASFERRLGSLRPVPRFDYADVRFVLERA